jgi:hypothetical protein
VEVAAVAVVGFAVLFGLAVLLALLLVWRRSRHGESPLDETGMLQELHRRCGEMERRVESLETLLLHGDDRR